MNGPHWQRKELSRRVFLAGSLAAGATLAACAKSAAPSATLESQPMATPTNLDAAIKAAEAARPHTGRTVSTTLTPRPVTVDLGGKIVNTLGYADTVPGPLIRANVGDELEVALTNKLNTETSMHWHGLAAEQYGRCHAGDGERPGRRLIHL